MVALNTLPKEPIPTIPCVKLAVASLSSGYEKVRMLERLSLLLALVTPVVVRLEGGVVMLLGGHGISCGVCADWVGVYAPGECVSLLRDVGRVESLEALGTETLYLGKQEWSSINTN